MLCTLNFDPWLVLIALRVFQQHSHIAIVIPFTNFESPSKISCHQASPLLVNKCVLFSRGHLQWERSMLKDSFLSWEYNTNHGFEWAIFWGSDIRLLNHIANVLWNVELRQWGRSSWSKIYKQNLGKRYLNFIFCKKIVNYWTSIAEIEQNAICTVNVEGLVCPKPKQA